MNLDISEQQIYTNNHVVIIQRIEPNDFNILSLSNTSTSRKCF